MKKIIFIISFLLIETVLGQNENSKLLHQEIDRYFQTVFEKSPAPGFSVVIVKKDKIILDYTKTYDPNQLKELEDKIKNKLLDLVSKAKKDMIEQVPL